MEACRPSHAGQTYAGQHVGVVRDAEAAHQNRRMIDGDEQAVDGDALGHADEDCDLPKLPSFSVRGAGTAAQAEFETAMPEAMPEMLTARAARDSSMALVQSVLPVTAGGPAASLTAATALAEEDHGGGEHDEEEAAEVGDERLFTLFAGLGAAGR